MFRLNPNLVNELIGILVMSNLCLTVYFVDPFLLLQMGDFQIPNILTDLQFI